MNIHHSAYVFVFWIILQMAGVVSANKMEGIYYIVAALAAIGIFMGVSLFGVNEKERR